MTLKDKLLWLVCPEKMSLIADGHCPDCRQWVSVNMLKRMSMLELDHYIMTGRCGLCYVGTGDKHISIKVWEIHGLSYCWETAKKAFNIMGDKPWSELLLKFESFKSIK